MSEISSDLFFCHAKSLLHVVSARMYRTRTAAHHWTLEALLLAKNIEKENWINSTYIETSIG